jgi:hypothetical protein
MLGVDCLNPFWVMAFFFVGFVAWINMFRVAHFTFPKIKEEDTLLYKEIIVRDGKGWLERGWYSPTDIGVQFSLYRSIYHGNANPLLSHGTWRGYVWSTRIFFAALIIAVVGSVMVFACYLSIR